MNNTERGAERIKIEAFSRCSTVGESLLRRVAQLMTALAAPLYDDANNPLGVAISFPDVSAYHRLQEELRRAREEIQTTNEELQSSNEELETPTKNSKH